MMFISHKRIGLNIKKARRQAGLTQEKLAELLNMSTVNYGRIERGEREASLKFLAHTAQALNVSLYDLLAGCSPGQPLPLLPHSACLPDLIRLLSTCSADTLRLIYSVCWLIAADLG